MARKASFGNTLAQRGMNTAAFLYALSWTRFLCLSLQFWGGKGVDNPPIFSPGIFQKESKRETLGLERKMHRAKIKTMRNTRINRNRCVPKSRAGSVGERLRVPVRLSKGLGLPPAELGHRSSSPTQMAPSVWGHREGACGWLGGQWSSELGRPPRCTLVPEGGGSSVPPSLLFPLAK